MTAIEKARKALAWADENFTEPEKATVRIRYRALRALVAEYRVQHAWRPDSGPEWVAFCGDPDARPLDPAPATAEEALAIPVCNLCHRRAMSFAREQERASREAVTGLPERLSVSLSDDEREALAEIVARAIRASRYSGKMVATPQPPEWHNPVDLRNGRRAVAAILASDVWRNRRQGPITDDESEALAIQFANLIFEYGLRSPDSTKALIAFKEVAAGFRRQGLVADAVREQIEFNESKIAWTENNFLPGPYGAAAIAQYEYAIEQLREALEAVERARSEGKDQA